MIIKGKVHGRCRWFFFFRRRSGIRNSLVDAFEFEFEMFLDGWRDLNFATFPILAFRKNQKAKEGHTHNGLGHTAYSIITVRNKSK
jgi:hypothetical protein